MTKLIELTALDPIIDKLNFKSYISTVERRFERFYLPLKNRGARKFPLLGASH